MDNLDLFEDVGFQCVHIYLRTANAILYPLCDHHQTKENLDKDIINL